MIQKLNYLIKLFILQLRLFIRYKKIIHVKGKAFDSLYLGKYVTIDRDVTFVLNGGCIKIGDYCIIRKGCYISTEGGDISIGKNCSLNPYVILYGDGGLRILDDVRIAAFVMIVPGNHIYNNKELLIRNQGMSKKGVVVENDVWLGSNVVVLDGVLIKKGSVIGASSVVSRSLEEYSVSVGIPAKTIKYRT